MATPENTRSFRLKRRLDRKRAPIGAAKVTTSKSAIVFRDTETVPRKRNCNITVPLLGLMNWEMNDQKTEPFLD
jgi:hypothetical protein